MVTDWNVFFGNLLQIPIFNWVAFWMQCNKSPTFVTQSRHYVFVYICLYPYIKQLFMKKSHVLGINSCICIPSEEITRIFVWRLVKCSSKCHTLYHSWVKFVSLQEQYINSMQALKSWILWHVSMVYIWLVFFRGPKKLT